MSAPTTLRAGDRVLVTGASGFLGGALVSALRAHGCDVSTVSRSDGFDFARDALPLDGVRRVFHLAGATGVPAAWADPASFVDANATSTTRVLEQARCANAEVLYVGAYIYGRPQRLPIAEDHPVDPNNPYALSKWMGEAAATFYGTHHGTRVASIRLFNVYGPGQSDRFAIPHIVNQAVDPERETIEVLDLAPKRDYLYVDDAIAAFLAVTPDETYRVFNVGSGVSHSVADVIASAQRAAGTDKRVVSKASVRQNEIPDVVADIASIRGHTGWSPRVDLDAGIARMVAAARTSRTVAA